MRNRQALLIAIVLTFIATMLFWAWKNSIEEKAIAGMTPKPVLVAKHRIPKFTYLAPHMVKVKEIPAMWIQPSPITTVEDLLDEDGHPFFITTNPIEPNEQIMGTKLTIPGKGTGLEVAIPKEYRAVTIDVDEADAVAGLIRPGNYVDVIGVFKNMSFMLLQNMKVLAVAREIVGEEYLKKGVAEKAGGPLGQFGTAAGLPGAPSNITLAATPTDALKLAYAEQTCNFKLVLRAFADTSRVSRADGYVNTDRLMGKPAKKSVTPDTIEIIKGGRRGRR